MKKLLKKKISFFAFIISISLQVFAQNPLIFDLQPDKSSEKKVMIQKNFTSPDFNLFIGIVENPETNSIKLSFRRGDEGDGLFLCYSFVRSQIAINKMTEFMSGEKKLWIDKKTQKEIPWLNYFWGSKDLALPRGEYYKLLPPNNFHELDMAVVNFENRILINLYFYVAQEKKKRKRTTQLLYQVDPITIIINKAKDPCSETEKIIADIHTQIEQLEIMQAKAKEIVKNISVKNCEVQLSAIHQEIITNFLYEKPQWEEHPDCQNVKDSSNKYKALRSAILKEQCPAPDQPSSLDQPNKPNKKEIKNTVACDLEEINERLKNLQKDINRKKGKKSFENERNEFINIKNLADNNIASANCKKELIETYKNYCTNIEKLLND
jgi:hypothetical protein